MDTDTDLRTLGSDQLCTFLVADSGIIVCPCHYYLVSTLFQDILKQKRNVQIQLILRETAEGTSGSGGSLGLHGGGTGAVRLCGAHINIFTLMSGIDPDDMAVVGSRRGIITAIGESLTTGFTENRGFGRFLTVFGFRCPFMFNGVVFDSFFCLCPLLQVFVGCLFLFDLGCIKFDILFHGFLLFLDRFDHRGHFLVNGIDLPVGFIAESKK